MTLKQLSMAASLAIVCACASDTDASQPEAADADSKDEPATAADNGKADAEDSKPGVTSKGDALTFLTEPVTVEPGQETYQCFTAVIDEDAVVDTYTHETQPFVHHVVFVRTLAPEPEGFSECDVLFRNTWDPLFITGAGKSELKFPDNAGHKIAKGTQLLAQLHLLNATDKPITQGVQIGMHRSEASDVTPVGTFVFGTTKLDLPAGKESSVQGDCELKEPVNIVAAFPHMHQLGKKLRFEAGSTMDTMKSMFVRDPYDFDDQHIEPVDIQLSAGDKVRVTCDYENTTDHAVTFGESTKTEMCYFITFSLDRERISGCTAK